MNDLNSQLKKDNSLLIIQLERSVAENKRLQNLLDKNATSNGLSNEALHQFNNIAALVDANIELALNSLLNLRCNESKTNQRDVTTTHNFITAAQNANTELVGLVNN